MSLIWGGMYIGTDVKRLQEETKSGWEKDAKREIEVMMMMMMMVLCNEDLG